MGGISKKDWLDKASVLRTRHDALNCVSDRDLRVVMAELWFLVRDPPSGLYAAYRELKEQDLKPVAIEAGDALTDGQLIWKTSGNWDQDALSLGAQLRALDAELAARPSYAGAPSHPRSLYLGEVEAYVIPRSPPKPIDRRPGPGNGFGRRAIPHHRIIPERIQDRFSVSLEWNPHLAPGRVAGGDRILGAALFPDLTHKWIGDSENLVADEAVCADEDRLIDLQVEGAFSASLLAAVWPELSMPAGRLKALQAAMNRRAGAAAPGEGPAIVAAGSWHENDGGKIFNRMRILDRSGKERLHFDKITTFIGGAGREGNTPSDRIPVLINQDALITFAICSDFCDIDMKVPYLDLDVDLVLIASLGNKSAMKGHEANSRELHAQLGASTFLVQQHETSANPLGWVFPEKGEPPSLEENEPWSVRNIRFS